VFIKNVDEIDFNEVVNRGLKAVTKPPTDGIYVDAVNQKFLIKHNGETVVLVIKYRNTAIDPFLITSFVDYNSKIRDGLEEVTIPPTKGLEVCGVGQVHKTVYNQQYVTVKFDFRKQARLEHTDN
jgi:hypothetical protein